MQKEEVYNRIRWDVVPFDPIKSILNRPKRVILAFEPIKKTLQNYTFQCKEEYSRLERANGAYEPIKLEFHPKQANGLFVQQPIKLEL